MFSFAILATLIISSCSDDDNQVTPTDPGTSANFEGAVYAMSNGSGQVTGTPVQGANTIIAYGRNTDGTLDYIGEYATGGNGGDFDGGEGLDPLISAYALSKTTDNNFVLAVNAGSGLSLIHI